MGVGPSRVGPTTPENDISFKSLEEKPSHKKKAGFVRFIIDALLGERSSPSPDELGFASFSESPESGTDFDVEETFVDAPLPAARQGNEAKSEGRVTPGRARAKKRGVTSEFSISLNVQYIEERSQPSNQDGEVPRVKPIEKESNLNVTRLRPTSNVSNESPEILWSHGRGDNTPSATTNSKVDKRCPTTVSHENLETPKKLDDPCEFQSNNSNVNIPSSETHETTTLSSIQKIVKISVAESDIVNHDEGGGKLKAGNDPNTFAVKEETLRGSTASNDIIPNVKPERPLITTASIVLPPTNKKKSFPVIKRPQEIPRRNPDNQLIWDKKRVDMFTVEKKKDPTNHQEALGVSTFGNGVLSGSGQGNALQRQATQNVRLPLLPFPVAAQQNLLYPNRAMMKTETPISQDGPLDVVVKRPAEPVKDLHSNPVTPGNTHVGTPLGVEDSKADSVGRKENQDNEKRSEVPKVQTIFQKQIPSVAELKGKVEEARKELDSIEKCIRAANKRAKIKSGAHSQVRMETITQRELSAPAPLRSMEGGISIGAQGEGQKKTLHSPVFDKPIPKLVVFKGKKVDTAATAERKSVQQKESKEDLKTPIPCTGEEKSTDGAFVTKKGPVMTRLASRNTLRRKASLRPVKTSCGSDKHPEPLPSKVLGNPPIQCVDHCDTDVVTVATTNTPKGEAEQVNQCTTLTCSLPRIPSVSDMNHTRVDTETTDDSNPPLPQQFKKPICRGSDPLTEGTVLRMNPVFSTQRKNHVDIKKLINFHKTTEQQLDSNEVSIVFIDGSMHALSMKWMQPITCNVFIHATILLFQYLPKIKQSTGKYFPGPSTSNIRRLYVTKMSDKDLESLFQESLTWWERKRSAVLFNSKFYPRRLFMPYFDKLGNNIELSAESYYVHGVQYLPVIVDYQEIECGITAKEDESYPKQSVLTSRDHSKTSLQFAKEHMVSVLAELNKLVMASLKSQSAGAVHANLKPGEAAYWYSEMNNLSRRMNSIEADSASTGTGCTNSYDNMLIEYHRVLQQFNEWKQKLIVCKEAFQNTANQLSKLGERETTTVVQHGAENTNMRPDHNSDERSVDARTVPTGSSKTTSQVTNQESVGEVTIKIPLVETGEDVPLLNKVEASSKTETKAETKSQIVSGECNSKTGADGRPAKRKLGRGPRIVGDMRRIVHCQRNRHTDIPTTQLKIKFCLGCGDTRQPNGEPLIQCATCDQAFFCCTKCQRETRNEHRQTCKGVKRHYCRHW